MKNLGSTHRCTINQIWALQKRVFLQKGCSCKNLSSQRIAFFLDHWTLMMKLMDVFKKSWHIRIKKLSRNLSNRWRFQEFEMFGMSAQKCVIVLQFLSFGQMSIFWGLVFYKDYYISISNDFWEKNWGVIFRNGRDILGADSQKVLNVPRILKLTLIMFLNIEVQKSYLNGLNLRKENICHLKLEEIFNFERKYLLFLSILHWFSVIFTECSSIFSFS